MFSDCVLGFAQMLYVALKEYYLYWHDLESIEDYLRGKDQLTFDIKYPGLPSTTIWTLMQSYQNCVDFLWTLFGVSGYRLGSAYFFVHYDNTEK